MSLKTCHDCWSFNPDDIDGDYCDRVHEVPVVDWLKRLGKAASSDPELLVNCAECPGFEDVEDDAV